MSKSLIVICLVTALVAAGGCATIHTSDVSDLNSKPKGVRVYAPRTYFMVDSTVTPAQTLVLTLPDPCRAYDVRPITIFAKQDFTVELSDDSTLSKLTANQDTTAFLTFAKDAAQVAAKAAGMPVSQGVVNGTFGLADGVYRFDDAGRLVSLYGVTAQPSNHFGECP